MGGRHHHDHHYCDAYGGDGGGERGGTAVSGEWVFKGERDGGGGFETGEGACGDNQGVG